MKKVFMYFLAMTSLVCATMLSSCSKDDDGSSIDAANIVGTWKVTKVEGVMNGKVIGTAPQELVDERGEWTFSADGTVSTNGDKARYEIKNNRIIFDGDESEGTTTIKKLTSSEMVLEVDYRLLEMEGYVDRVTFKKIK